MHYLKFGDSKTCLVFLHGWGCDLNFFLWVKDYFPSYSTLFVDFYGFGKSAEPSKPMCVDDYVFELKKIIDLFDIENLILIGHSFGGRVAIKFTSKFQFDYKNFKLCLVDSAGILPKRGVKFYYKIFAYKLCKKLSKKVKWFDIKLNKFGSRDYKNLSPIMKKTFVCVVNEDLSKFAKMISVETIIIWGEKDTETKLFMAKRLYKIIPNSRLHVFKNAGHFSFLDKKEDFLILLDTLCKNL